MTKLYPFLLENNQHPIMWDGSQLERWKNIPLSDSPISESY